LPHSQPTSPGFRANLAAPTVVEGEEGGEETEETKLNSTAGLLPKPKATKLQQFEEGSISARAKAKRANNKSKDPTFAAVSRDHRDKVMKSKQENPPVGLYRPKFHVFDPEITNIKLNTKSGLKSTIEM
jgi:hypothetical protein